MSKISVIVPVFRGEEAFNACIEALSKAAPPPDEIIVIADGGLDGSCYYLEKLGVKLIETSAQLV